MFKTLMIVYDINDDETKLVIRLMADESAIRN